MTSMLSPISAGQGSWSAADDSDHEPISFDRCVDWLLDLHRSTDEPELKLIVAEVLDDVRELGPVTGEFAEVVLGALASVEAAFDIASAAKA